MNIGETVLYDGNYYFVVEKNDNTGVIGFDKNIVLNSNIAAIEVKVIFGYAIGQYSHSEGYSNASSDYSHSEGEATVASGECSHSEGLHTQAIGDCSHAEGYYTMALKGSHAEGVGTVAQIDGEHAQGLYNISHALQDNHTIHSTGIGYFDNKTNYEYRKNAFEILDNGDIFAYNVGGFDGIHVENIHSLQNVINNIYDRPVFPSYSSADAGKILSINALGQLEWITPIYIYTGSNAPSNSVGNNGDIYMQS